MIPSPKPNMNMKMVDCHFHTLNLMPPELNG